MPTLAIIALAVVGLLVLIVLIGLLMPERYEGRAYRTYDRSPEEVWASLEDYRAHPMTGKMADSFEDLPAREGLPCWVEQMRHGEKIEVTTTESERPHTMTRAMRSRAVPMTSTWIYVLDEKDGGTQVTIEGTTDIRRGTWHVPIFRVMMLLGGGVKKGLDIQLDMLAETLADASA